MVVTRVIETGRRTGYSGHRLLLALGVFLPVLSLGQAGSRPPLEFHHPDAGGFGGSAAAIAEPMMPAGVLRLADDERYLLWVELASGQLSVLERNSHGGMDVLRTLPVSIGKNGFGKQSEGDRKTPVGVYRLTSFLTDDVLQDEYGPGAFPLNYPNVIDRQAGHTGSGIWLHGLPRDVATRPLQDSDGCVVIDNDSLMAMHDVITTGLTHMVLSDRPLTWVPAGANSKRQQALQQAFEQWQQAWEARDNRSYLAYYAHDFSDFTRNKSQWSDYKSRVNNGKHWIEVGVSRISFYADINHPELVTVRYYQDYRSDNYHWSGWKEQQWRESESGWQIVYEGNG